MTPPPACRPFLVEDKGTTIIEPLVAIALLIATIAPLGAALLRVTMSHGPAELALAARAAVSAAETARATCAVLTPLPAPPSSQWVLTSEVGFSQGIRVVSVRVADRDGRILTSLVAPCVSE